MRQVLVLLISMSALACRALDPPPPPPQEIHVRIHSDPGKPTSGAQLLFQGKAVATTDAAGLGKLRLNGREGDVYDITVRCPPGHQPPEKPVRISLRRLSESAKVPEFSATCPLLTRAVVVAVRALNVPDLPVTYLGKEVARTDESGAAHVLLRLTPGEKFELTLDTTDARHGTLRPQSPAASFVVGQSDDVFSFDQKFEDKRPVVRRRAPAMPVKVVRQR